MPEHQSQERTQETRTQEKLWTPFLPVSLF
jgi:hypothetical protein